jgi:site-specific recombinase XerD
MVQKWLGHSDIRTTVIYSNAVGKEERNVAQRLWEDE